MRKLLFVLLFFATKISAQNTPISNNYHTKWTDSVIKTLTLKQQIAQMMMVATWSNLGSEHIDYIENLLRNYQIGGLLFFQGHPQQQALLTNYYQQISRYPILVSMDAEWGTAMRLNKIEKFPFHATLGAANNDSLAYLVGYKMGLEARLLGVHLSYAPVMDCNTNMYNPIIGFRSFGQDPKVVAAMGIAMSKGLQDANVIACAKHFPGHGDTKTDSHNDLPIIPHNKLRLDSVELFPFIKAVKNNIGAMMVAHLDIPLFNTNGSASLSENVVKNKLQNELKFNGLVITDAMNMQGVLKNNRWGEAEAKAVLAGNDIICYPNDVPLAIETIYNYVKQNKIDSSEISRRVLKILYYKQWCNLDKNRLVDIENLSQKLLDLDVYETNYTVAKNAITVVKNSKNKLPFSAFTNKKIAYWQIGNGNKKFAYQYLKMWHNADSFFTNSESNLSTFSQTAKFLKSNYDAIIIGVHDIKLWGKQSVTLPQPVVQAIYECNSSITTIPIIYGNTFTIHNIPNLPQLIVAYEDEPAFHRASMEIIFGQIQPKGKLPYTVWQGYEKGVGETWSASNYFEPILVENPLSNGFKNDFSDKLNALCQDIIDTKTAPGGQIVVYKNGKNIYTHAFGTYTYDSSNIVDEHTIFDLASVSKTCATTLTAMKLLEENKLNLDSTVGYYLHEATTTNKKDITVRQLLLHEAGLIAWIPFYKQYNWTDVFSNKKSTIYSMQISNHVYMKASYVDSIWNTIWNSELRPKGRFVYSDLSMLILQRIIQRITKISLDEYVQQNFYSPMNLKTIGYNPLKKFPENYIIPSVLDDYFRFEKVQGFVHDPCASMLGGVCGHAGVFSNATDLAIVYQMLLNGGNWNGKMYLKQSTIKLFTSNASKISHRGLGFDRATGFGKKQIPNVSKIVPAGVFGHSGYTGTWVWADPKNNLVFVFLSNRCYPHEQNKKLVNFGFRTKAIEIVYEALD